MLIKNMKKVIITTVLLLAFLFIPFHESRSNFQPYYSGDAINYHKQLVFGSTNSGYLEIFKLQNKNIVPIVKLRIFRPSYNTYDDFSSFKFKIENGSLYVYAVSKYTLYKYDLSDLKNIHLVDKVRNTYWEWYDRIDSLGGDIGTISKNGVKIMDSKLQQINGFNFVAQDPYNIRSDSKQFLFSVNQKNINIFDRYSRRVIRQIPLDFHYDNLNHKIYYDVAHNYIYAIDDNSTKKFRFDGTLVASFRHLKHPGYDIVGNDRSPYIYFSNGVGVVKMSKRDFKVLAYTYTTNLANHQGWAMGLSLVSTSQGDYLVVFNNSNILILDKNLHKIASQKANTDQGRKYPQESLYLVLSRNWAVATQKIKLNGGGFWSQEKLTIDLAGNKTELIADSQGRFSKDLLIPSLKPGRYDIKVNGNDSGLHYSISLDIK